MDKKLLILTNFFLHSISPSVNEKLTFGCTEFVQRELSIMPVFYKIPVYLLIYIFFAYAFMTNYFRFFSGLSQKNQSSILFRWENSGIMGFTLCRLLRNLIFLYYFDRCDLAHE